MHSSFAIRHSAFGILALGLIFMAQVSFAQEEEKPPVLREKIRDISPDGKHALRITYDQALNEKMLPKNTPPKGGIFSHTIHAMAIVSLPGKEIRHDLAESGLEGGSEFNEITLLWSADSKWCAFYFTYPKVGYTWVFHLRGEKFKLAQELYELENMTPARWAKPGVLELGDEDAPSATATFDGKGKFKLRQKKK